MKKKISIVGTVGVPANYGGFETLVENLLDSSSMPDVEYIIYCSGSYDKRPNEHKKAKLIYIPLKANGIQSTFYDIWALIHASFSSDVILILGVSGCCFLPIFRIFSTKRLIINIDGLEHKRNKWNKLIKRFLLFSEKMAVKYGNIIISDNKNISDYVQTTYNKSSELITYGGDHVICNVSLERESEILLQYDLKYNDYAISICRIEPENNVHLILEAFNEAQKKLVFIGNWDKNKYGRELLKKYSGNPFIKMLFPIYEIDKLYVLRSNCTYYVHGHSAGGTNPSLVEAMFFSKPIFAFDVIYNRETTENKANYFVSVSDLVTLLEQPSHKFISNAINMFQIAGIKYRWEVITRQYEHLIFNNCVRNI